MSEELELLLFVVGVFPAELAELLLLELVDRLQTLVRRVVAVRTSRADKEDIAILDLHWWSSVGGVAWDSPRPEGDRGVGERVAAPPERPAELLDDLGDDA